MRRGCQPRKRSVRTMASRRKPIAEVAKSSSKLRAAGLRPTRQRLLLADLLFRQGNRHLTAELLHQETKEAGYRVSLATVYNTLHQFTSAGLLRQVVVEPS